MEKRFQIGDVIKVPGHTEGVVEQIGFRSTHKKIRLYTNNYSKLYFC